ncbi:hypothetical protein EYV94_02015 [Puteibacter caeruleilacunae]|nr:hypothetical protein EYV94_02015 [Puteibacter caeruleilacunae]
MKNIVEILYKPVQVFVRLDEMFVDDLNSNSNFIVGILGLVTGGYTCFAEYSHIKEFFSGGGAIGACIGIALVTSALFVLLYNFVLTYLLYGIGRLLGASGLIADTRCAIAYSLVPRVFISCLLLVLVVISESLFSNAFLKWVLLSLEILIWLWGLILLVIGFNTLNKYGIMKAVINSLPMVGILVVRLILSEHWIL